MSETSDKQNQGLAKEVIQSLSKEIEANTNNMMVFRVRIGFGLLVGPFLLLGSFVVAARGQRISFELDKWAIAAIFMNGFCFIVLAYICARIEEQVWEQCRKWRNLIALLFNDSSAQIPETQRKSRNMFLRAYLTGYSLLFVSVVCTIIIMTKVRVTAP